MRAIPDDNLRYPVLVEYDDQDKKTHHASGFFLNTETDSFFVTARHVLFDHEGKNLVSEKVSLLSYARDLRDTSSNQLELNMPVLHSSGNVRAHETHDVAIARIAVKVSGERGTVVKGVEAKRYAESGLLGVNSTESIRRFSEVLVGNEAYVFGYPVSIGLEKIPQIEYKKPLLRKGIIAGKNEGQKTIILDCPLYPGNSGGPVVEVEQEGFQWHFRVVGVVSQMVPVVEKWVNDLYGIDSVTATNSGYSVAVPMDCVLELVG